MQRFIILAVLLYVFIFSATSFGMENYKIENNPIITINKHENLGETSYKIKYSDTESVEEIIENTEEINLLLINGTFVPNSEIIYDDNNFIRIPLRLVVEYLGGDIEWDSDLEQITVNIDNLKIIMQMENSFINVNGYERYMPSFTRIINDKVYIYPSDLLSLGIAYTDYTLNFEVNTGFNTLNNDVNINQVIIESTSSWEKFESAYEIYEALNKVKKLSLDTYNQTVDYVLENYDYDLKNIYNEHDSQNIKYIGDMGRYYIFELNGYEDYKIFFNRYTGEIFSQQMGSHLLSIEEGFINIIYSFKFGG